jgi:dynein regulatory complex subunit 2
METLLDYQKLGERILKTAELCRKLETEKEKVLPFYQSDPDSMEDAAHIKVDGVSGLSPGAYNEFQMLDNFYKRFNKVSLDKLAI